MARSPTIEIAVNTLAIIVMLKTKLSKKLTQQLAETSNLDSSKLSTVRAFRPLAVLSYPGDVPSRDHYVVAKFEMFRKSLRIWTHFQPQSSTSLTDPLQGITYFYPNRNLYNLTGKPASYYPGDWKLALSVTLVPKAKFQSFTPPDAVKYFHSLEFTLLKQRVWTVDGATVEGLLDSQGRFLGPQEDRRSMQNKPVSLNDL